MTLRASSDQGRALEAWQDAIGAAHVLVDPATRGALESATYRVTRRALGVLRPGDREQVQSCVRIANRFGVPIYPISRGRNWGLGSRLPATDGCMVLELSRLDRIVDYSEPYGYLTVEPGVTFASAFEYLRERGSRLMLNTTYGPPDGSLVGNALERGHGSGAYFDRFRHVGALEVVLPTGEIIRTGLLRSGGAHAARLHQWGSGPYLDGLFSQSNLGIVTEMTCWLHPLPTDLTQFEFRMEGEDRIDAAVEVIRELRFDSRFRCQFNNIHRNTFDALAWSEGGKVAGPMKCPVRDPRLYLYVGGSLHCESALEGWALRRRVFGALSGKVDGLRYMSPARRLAARALKGPLDRLGVHVPEAALHPQLGAPGELRVAAMYAAKASGPRPAEVRDVDLDRDRCGVMWYCPVVPFAGEHVRRVLAIVEQTCEPFELQPQLTFSPHSPRCLDAFVALVFDRADAARDAAARECFDRLVDALSAAGYPPYRAPVDRMDVVADGAPDYAAFLRRLKQALDPNDVIAPGRYDGRAGRQPV